MEQRYEQPFHETLCSGTDRSFDLVVAPGNTGHLMADIVPDTESFKLNIRLEEAASLELFILNRAAKACTVQIEIRMAKDTVCAMNALDMESADTHYEQKVLLEGTGADFKMKTGQLCLPDVKRINHIEVIHKTGHTSGTMENYAVLFDRAGYEMVAEGIIEKGSKESYSDQKTRVLTLGQGHTAKVIPLLIIDENDVKAGHAQTIGQPDQDQLYYLCSRGLSHAQAIGLLSVGYLLPVIESVGDEKKQEELRYALESKVGLYGHQ